MLSSIHFHYHVKKNYMSEVQKIVCLCVSVVFVCLCLQVCGLF